VLFIAANGSGRRFREAAGILFEDGVQIFLTVRQRLHLFRGLYAGGNKRGRSDTACVHSGKKKASRIAITANFSGGQLQRLLLAAALVTSHDSVFDEADQPGLDPQARTQFWQLMQQARRRRSRSSSRLNYMKKAELLCDDIVIMDRGKIIARGQPLRRFCRRSLVQRAHSAQHARTPPRISKTSFSELTASGLRL